MTSTIPSTINLASDPFRRERAEAATFVSVCILLFCSLLVLVGLILHSRSEAGGLRRQIETQEIQLHDIQRQQSQFSAILGKPENADTFATSYFLNELIARRGVSWTQIFKDLGTVMPADMRLLAIQLPQVGQEGEPGVDRVRLDMILGTTQPELLISLLKKLEQSALFGAPSMVNQSPPSQNDPLYKYRVTVTYDQKL